MTRPLLSRWLWPDLPSLPEMAERAPKGLPLATERRKWAEKRLDEMEAARLEAEAANRAKSEFLAVMSHELRTPLNAIGGYAELIELGIHGPVTEAQRAALERIQRSQRHLLGLIAGVLDYSRVEAGAVSYRLSDIPVTEAVAEADSPAGAEAFPVAAEAFPVAAAFLAEVGAVAGVAAVFVAAALLMAARPALPMARQKQALCFR